jgi:hypothetical protein
MPWFGVVTSSGVEVDHVAEFVTTCGVLPSEYEAVAINAKFCPGVIDVPPLAVVIASDSTTAAVTVTAEVLLSERNSA